MGTGAGERFHKGKPKEARVFKFIGKLILLSIILSIVATVFNRVVKPRVSPGGEESA